MNNRDEYMRQIKERIDEYNSVIGRLRAEGEKAEPENKIAYLVQLEDLRSKYEDLSRRVEELRQSGEGVWEDLKQGLENSWDILKTSFIRAKSEFKRGYEEGREK